MLKSHRHRTTTAHCAKWAPTIVGAGGAKSVAMWGSLGISLVRVHRGALHRSIFVVLAVDS